MKLDRVWSAEGFVQTILITPYTVHDVPYKGWGDHDFPASTAVLVTMITSDKVILMA
jgi:hypothetical protein